MTRKDAGRDFADLGADLFDSIAWAFSEHVHAPDTGEYKSAVLYGNEDAPKRIDFFRTARPLITSKVAFTWTPEPIES